MKLRDAVQELAPPLLLRAARSALGRGLRFEGDYATWGQAQQASGADDSDAIARRVLQAELKVKTGEAADARDGVTFGEMQPAFPIIAALARVAACRSAGLRVLDIGGAFGRLYRQFKSFVPQCRLAWWIVEQNSYVTLGKEHFQNAELRFFADLAEIEADQPVDVVLLSSVLQYLPDPYSLIGRIVASGVRHVVIDRTPCSALQRDILCVQRVPPEIYKASYPCWIFSRARLMSAFGPRYAALASFADGSGRWRAGAASFELRGFILERNGP